MSSSLDLDTNINNYDLQKLLLLFDLDYEFNESDLKRAKKKVLMLHPDKSSVHESLFIFFVQAYKKLEMITKYIQHAKSEHDLSHAYESDDTLKNI